MTRKYNRVVIKSAKKFLQDVCEKLAKLLPRIRLANTTWKKCVPSK